MTFKYERINDVDVFTIEGDFTIKTHEAVYRKYQELLKNDRYKFVFDLTDIQIIDSTGIGTIIMGLSNCLDHNTKIKVCGLAKSPEVKVIFEIINLDRGIDFYMTLEDAVNSFNSN